MGTCAAVHMAWVYYSRWRGRRPPDSGCASASSSQSLPSTSSFSALLSKLPPSAPLLPPPLPPPPPPPPPSMPCLPRPDSRRLCLTHGGGTLSLPPTRPTPATTTTERPALGAPARKASRSFSPIGEAARAALAANVAAVATVPRKSAERQSSRERTTGAGTCG